MSIAHRNYIRSEEQKANLKERSHDRRSTSRKHHSRRVLDSDPNFGFSNAIFGAGSPTSPNADMSNATTKPGSKAFVGSEHFTERPESPGFDYDVRRGFLLARFGLEDEEETIKIRKKFKARYCEATLPGHEIVSKRTWGELQGAGDDCAPGPVLKRVRLALPKYRASIDGENAMKLDHLSVQEQREAYVNEARENYPRILMDQAQLIGEMLDDSRRKLVEMKQEQEFVATFGNRRPSM